MKRITWWPQAWLGLTFNWGALLGFAAANGAGLSTLGYVTGLAGAMVRSEGFGGVSHFSLAWPAVLLYASGVFWTLGYDTIYAVQDLEDDALAGVKSSARRLGEAAPRGVLVFYVICFALVVAAAWAGNLGPLFLPLAGLLALHLSRQASALRLDDPAGALALFKSNTHAGFVLFLALVAGMWKPAGF
jgi:4-hydroxybenzoate polyprenyltransferase